MSVYFVPSREAIKALHDLLPLAMPGFSAEGNFNFLFDTLRDFPESVTGITVHNTDEKVIYMSCYLLFHLASGHCFIDGNKRTAFLSFHMMLLLNNIIPSYKENTVKSKLDEVYNLIKNKELTEDAIEIVFKENRQSNEYKLIRLLFDLAGARGPDFYTSPVKIFDPVNEMVTPLSTALENIMKKSTDITEKDKIEVKTHLELLDKQVREMRINIGSEHNYPEK